MSGLKIAILDDYQEVALSLADWSSLNADVEVFTAPFTDAEEVVKRLADFDVLGRDAGADTLPPRHAVASAESEAARVAVRQTGPSGPPGVPSSQPVVVSSARSRAPCPTSAAAIARAMRCSVPGSVLTTRMVGNPA